MANAKKIVWGILRILIPFAILGWIVYDVHRHDPASFQRLASRPKDWRLVGLSLLFIFMAALLSFTRWYLLVRGLGIPMSLRDAFRLGFLGYMLNFVGPGAVGGDLYKAYFLARTQSSRRLEAIATIFLDRVIGLFCLMCVSSVSILLIDIDRLTQLRHFLTLLPWVTVAVGVTLALPLILPFRWLSLLDRCARLPIVGPILGSLWQRLEGALLLYRRRPKSLWAVLFLGLTVHLLMGGCIHFVDRALHDATPSLTEHFVISSIASAAGGLPVPGGIGTYEFAMHYVFHQLPAPTLLLEDGQGLAVALSYRVMTVMIASIGLVYYLAHRQEIKATMEQIQASPHEEPPPA